MLANKIDLNTNKLFARLDTTGHILKDDKRGRKKFYPKPFYSSTQIQPQLKYKINEKNNNAVHHHEKWKGGEERCPRAV
jgi:hypothetical protein